LFAAQGRQGPLSAAKHQPSRRAGPFYKKRRRLLEAPAQFKQIANFYGRPPLDWCLSSAPVGINLLFFLDVLRLNTNDHIPKLRFALSHKITLQIAERSLFVKSAG
jgi:hypothetical protein